ncbi:MAG: tetratricopeptide repeat protein [Candidatus Obscuribacterales bacterium]|nr:tetratricopeptide repeat protein [Candidatus Obscuribacterales bacterium]
MSSLSIFESGLEAYRSGKFSLAASYFRQLIAADPSNWDASFYLAMTLAQNSELKAAEAMFRSIIELCPNKELRGRAEIAVRTLSEMNRKK